MTDGLYSPRIDQHGVVKISCILNHGLQSVAASSNVAIAGAWGVRNLQPYMIGDMKSKNDRRRSR